MNGIAIKDIKGALIERNKCPIHGLKQADAKIGGCNCYEIGIENATLELQGQVRIGLNREKIAARLYLIKSRGKAIPEADMVMLMEECYTEADAIISDLNNLMEVVKC